MLFVCGMILRIEWYPYYWEKTRFGCRASHYMRPWLITNAFLVTSDFEKRPGLSDAPWAWLSIDIYIVCAKYWPQARKTQKTFWARVNPSSSFRNNSPIGRNNKTRPERTLCNFLFRFWWIYFHDLSPDFRGFFRFCTKTGPSTVWVPTLILVPWAIPTIPESLNSHPRQKH